VEVLKRPPRLATLQFDVPRFCFVLCAVLTWNEWVVSSEARKPTSATLLSLVVYEVRPAFCIENSHTTSI
jgi:hypothetical protein